jgi:hypothetical protein
LVPRLIELLKKEDLPHLQVAFLQRNHFAYLFLYLA